MGRKKIEKPFTNKFNKLKKEFKSGEFDLEKLDEVTREMIIDLADLTMKGITEIENVHIDTWKQRVWMIIENVGLLPEYKDTDEDQEEFEEDEDEVMFDEFDEIDPEDLEASGELFDKLWDENL